MNRDSIIFRMSDKCVCVCVCLTDTWLLWCNLAWMQMMPIVQLRLRCKQSIFRLIVFGAMFFSAKNKHHFLKINWNVLFHVPLFMILLIKRVIFVDSKCINGYYACNKEVDKSIDIHLRYRRGKACFLERNWREIWKKGVLNDWFWLKASNQLIKKNKIFVYVIEIEHTVLLTFRHNWEHDFYQEFFLANSFFRFQRCDTGHRSLPFD